MALPEVMQPVTDFSLIEPAMKDWERRKEIEQWRANLASLALTPGPEAEPVDFRLMILPRKAQVQWKAQSEDKFKDLKQAHLRLFSEKYRADSLAAVSEAMPLWLALYQPYDFHTACHLDYDRRESVKALGRILRLPDLAARVVNSDGAPLARPAEPLRYHLHPAQNESDDYRVGLVLADDSPAPPVLLALPGYPALYLTERAVFQGPPPHGFSVREPLRIPAPALECANGVDFLQRLTLDLPPRIVQRTRRVQVAVKLFCELKPTFPGSGTEAVFLRVVAEVAGDGKEDYGSGGWYSPPSEQLRKKEKKTGDDGVIRLLDRSAQRHFPGLLQALDAKWDDYHAKWRVRLTRAFPEVFVPWLEALPPEIEVHLKGELATLRNAPVSGRVRLDVEEAGVDWFDLKVALDVSDLELTPEELNLLLNARGRFVRLGAKGWRRLQFDLTPEEDERLARLGLNARDFTAEPQRLHALQLADEAARKFLPEQQVEKIRRRAAELKTRVTPPVPEGIRAALRPYQIEGFHFLAYLTANRFGGVLADDMGLGKTLQALTWLAWLRKNGSGPLRRDSDEPQSGQTEVQATSSDGHPDGRGGRPHVESGVLSSESGAVTSPISAGEPPGSAEGQMPVATALDDTGQPAAPTLVVCPKSVMENWRAEAERFFPGLVVRLWRGEEPTALPAARSEADLIVLNYAQLRGLSPDIAQHRWHAVVLDEAQYIKNPDSQTAQIARTLQAEHRLALTGTPIENRLLDLWSILAFAMPGALGNRTRFTRSYHQPDDPFARRRLAARVRPFLLRRTKAQVAQDLPDRIEEDLVCEMEGEQKTLYRAEFKRAQQLLLNIRTQQELNEQRFHFLTSLLRLRQICCHPALVNTDLSKAESAKVNALLDLLEPLMDEGHKVLVFSQFVTMLEILRDTAKGRGWPHFYLAGQTENRGKLVQGFQEAPGAAVFLISLKAGGFGLNLTAASYVVLFDPWWNPAVEMQAIDRTHRIGQTSKVMAYRLLIKDSIEQKIRQLQRSKAALVQDVLGEETFAQKLTLEDLRFLFAGE
jgi:SNF2 family DNA or RNA helicase